MPARLRASALELQRMRDRAKEADEELAQLEIMYAEQDLEDMTREFVIARGRRDHERSLEALAIREQEQADLESHELPRQLAELERELQQEREALEQTRLEIEAQALEDQIALIRAEGVLEGLRSEEDAGEETGEERP